MKRLKKAIAMGLAVCLVMTSTISALAAIKGMQSTPITNYRIYHNILDWGVDSNSGLSFFTLDGVPAFCIQAGRAVRGTNGEAFYPGQSNSFDIDFTVSELTKDDSIQSKAAYLGYYSLPNPTIKDYTFTQMMIWQTLPAQSITANGMTNGQYNSYFVDSSVRAEYEAWKAKIQEKIDTWDVYPSFNGTTKNHKIQAGESIVLTDTNGVFEDYNAFMYSKNGITVKHTKDSNTLTVIADKNCESKSVVMRVDELMTADAQKYDSKISANYVYTSDNSQDMATYGSIGDPLRLSLSFNVDVVTGKVAIEKTKSPDAASDETLPEEGAEFQIYAKSAGSYAAASEDYRDILTTDSVGKAMSKDLPHGPYIVHQTKGAAGHKFVEDFEVVIGTDEHDKVYTYKVNNETLQSKIQIIKKDAETGKVIPRAGVEFELTNLTTGEKIEGTSKGGYFVTDKNGCINLPNPLYYGPYRLTERKAPEGYVLAEPIEFTVDGTEKTIVVEAHDISQKGKIKIHKTGEILQSIKENDDGSYSPVFGSGKMEGAEFEITAAEDIVTPDGTVRAKKGQLVLTMTTDGDGNAESSIQYLGKYDIRETKAPYGHVIDDTVYTVELKYAGQEVEITDTSIDLENDRQTAKICLTKAIEEDELFGIEANDVYEDIKFGLFADEEIKAADGSVIPAGGLIEVIGVQPAEKGENSGEDNSTAEGREDANKYNKYLGIFKKDIPFATLYVQEIATNEQYITNDTKYPIEFSYAGQDTAVVEIKVNDGNSVKNDLIRGEVVGYKTGDKDKPLAGAVFGLFRPDEKEFIAENAIMTIETDEDGLFKFTEIPYGEWLIREIAAPRGYLVSDKLYEINISDDLQVIEIAAENAPKIGYAEFFHHAGMMDDKVYMPVKTGDNNYLTTWLIILTVTGNGLAGAVFCYKKRRKQ
ncbi:MAG: Cys-Gln thioester bond-forming surface protein [Firmicutes bacterium]|nr:Cys-Gln thioester bond-forming surface protein [Bacillota bacterium]